MAKPKESTMVTKYPGYNASAESTKIDPGYLIPGSKNVLISIDQLSVYSRPGMEILGAASDNSHSVLGSGEWRASTGLYHNFRAYDKYLQVLFDGTWYNLKTDLTSPRIQFAPIFVSSEKQDILCFVNGENKHYNWSGGVAKVASNTSTTLTMQGTMTASTIAFVASSPPTITDSANGFVTAGFATGDTISVSGSTSNNRKFQIASVVAGTITLIADDSLTAEASGASITIHNGFATWKSRGFLIAGTRSVIINGTAYAYTGGEDTATLTGLSGLGAITAGTVVLQSIRSNNNHASLPTGFTNDFIGSQRQQLWLGSATSREAWASKTTDFTDFSFTANRLPGEGVQVVLDGPCRGFEASDDDITIFDASDGIYTVKYQLSSDNSKEAISLDKKKSSPGQGLIAPNAKVAIKNAVAFITQEPTLDTLGDVENVPSAQSRPLSDPIKDDFEQYDFSDAMMKYWKRNIVVSLPQEGIVLLYDLRGGYWQPPQMFGNIGLISISEDGDLIGHSSISNESYTLFTGTNDNGFPIPAVMRHAWSTYGLEDLEKGFNRYKAIGYISANGILTKTNRFEQASFLGEDNQTLDATQSQYLFGASDVNWLGKNPLGSRPLGGSGISGEEGLIRFRKWFDMPEIPFYEQQTEFSMDVLDAQFIITSHGPNVSMRQDQDPYLTSA